MYKLLIVDDEEIERRAIEYIVERGVSSIGEIMQATNGQEAVALASTFEPDIIIMDISMPGLNGIKSADVIKKFLPDAHIIFLTAYDEFNYAKEAVKIGADDFVVKPASHEMIEKAIESSINSIEEKNRQVEKSETTKEKLKDASKYLQECLVEALIAGESNREKIEKYFSFINIDFEYSYGSVVSIDFLDKNRLSRQSLEIRKELIFEKFNAKIQSEIEKCITYIKGNYLYIITFDTEYEKLIVGRSRLREVVGALSKKISQEYNAAVDFGVGDISKSVETIWCSFAKAKEQINKKSDVETGDFSTSLLEKLTTCILNNSVNEIKSVVVDLQAMLRKDNYSIEDYRIRLLEFSILLKQMIIQKTNRPISIDDGLYIVASKVNSVDEGAEFVQYYIDSLCRICAMDDKDKNAIIVNQLALYINEHISENITLEQLAEVSKLSTFYICKLFKKYLKMNFSDYVTYIRIKKAKKLLVDPCLSIKEISFKTGYADPNYFTRVFKKETGVSPTSFRKQYMI